MRRLSGPFRAGCGRWDPVLAGHPANVGPGERRKSLYLNRGDALPERCQYCGDGFVSRLFMITGRLPIPPGRGF